MHSEWAALEGSGSKFLNECCSASFVESNLHLGIQTLISNFQSTFLETFPRNHILQKQLADKVCLFFLPVLRFYLLHLFYRLAAPPSSPADYKTPTVANDDTTRVLRYRNRLNTRRRLQRGFLWVTVGAENKPISHFKRIWDCYLQPRAKILFHQTTVAKFLLWKKIWEQNM